MGKKDLNSRFEKAFEVASAMTEKLPQDLMLRFYAYYKQATYGDSNYPTRFDVRNAFKYNAWLQVRGLTQDQAKEKYIELTNELTGNNI